MILRPRLLRWLLSIAMIAAGLVWPGLAVQAAQGTPFRDTLGLVVKFSQGQPLSRLAMLDELGVRWVRDTVRWEDMEPKAGQYEDFPTAFAQRLAYYRAHKIGVIFMLAYGNARAYPPTQDQPLAPIDPLAFGRYAAQIARMLKQAGVSFVLEVWNEPHNYVIRKMVGGQWNGRPPSPWVAHYVKMVREVVTQVKKQDPSVRVIDCEDVWVAHYWFLDAGLPADLDGFGIHPYSGASAPGPEVAAVSDDTDWARPFQLVDRDRAFGSAVRRLREQGARKLGKKPSIWITEWGWRVGETSPEGPVTEQMIAAFLPRAFISAAAAGVEVTCWFSAQDTVDGPMGLLANDGRRRPAFGAFRTLARELGDLVLDRQLTGAAQPTRGVQAYVFSGPQGRKVVIWSADNLTRSLKLDGRWDVEKAVDLQGEPIALRGTKGAALLTVGPEPIYLSIGGSRAITWFDDLIQ